MKNIIILLSVLAFGCSSDESKGGNESSVESDLKLLKMVETDIQSHSVYTVDYRYSDNKLISETFTIEDNRGSHAGEVSYSYDEQGKLTRRAVVEDGMTSSSSYIYTNELVTTVLNSEDNLNFKHTYVYNNLSQIISSKQYTGDHFDSETTYEYFNNNISKRTNSAFSTFNIYEYDNHPVPTAMTYPSAILKIFENGPNNVTRKTSSDGYVLDYVYEYNSDGLPSKETEKHNDVLISTKVYSYGLR